MATTSIWSPSNPPDPQRVNLGTLSVNLLALTYAGLIGFKRSTIHFRHTKKKWKLVLLPVLTIAGLLLILLWDSSIAFTGHVIAGLTAAFCVLWFDSDVKAEMTAEQGYDQE